MEADQGSCCRDIAVCSGLKERNIAYDAHSMRLFADEWSDAASRSAFFGFSEFLAAGGTPTTLYRAVGPNELADIGAAGGRYRVRPGGTEGKYFFETPEQASNFARMMGDKPYTTTSVSVSPSQLRRGQPINPAREGPGYFFSTPDVPSGPVNIFNHSVLP